jgi:hypothetical protein
VPEKIEIVKEEESVSSSDSEGKSVSSMDSDEMKAEQRIEINESEEEEETAYFTDDPSTIKRFRSKASQ